MTPPIAGPSEGLNAAVAAELRAERAVQRLTLQELSDAADVPLMSVRRYLNADRHIDVAVLHALAIALGTTARDIVRRAQDRMPPSEALDAVAHGGEIEGSGEEHST